MNPRAPNDGRGAPLALLGAGALALAVGASLVLVPRARPVLAAPSSMPLAAAPAAVPLAAEAAAEPSTPAPVPESPAPAARLQLEAWVAELAAELVHEPYQPRTFQERLEGCLLGSNAATLAELEAWLADPPRRDADLVALASLGRAKSLRLAPALASRLRPLALREDLPFGLAVEAARALASGGGPEELGWWSAALEDARNPRARAIAAGALAALHDGAAERFLVERALELGDPRASGRLLDALGRALEALDLPADPRGAMAGRLADVAGDARADAGLRARALGVLRSLDPDAAERVASDWFLEPGAGAERLEFAANSLRGRAGALATLQSAEADARVDTLRRVRLAECVLFTPDAQSNPEAREEGLIEMRSALRDSQDGAARRRALHALERFGTEADRALVQQAAEGDPDPLARAAARSARMREASDWR